MARIHRADRSANGAFIRSALGARTGERTNDPPIVTPYDCLPQKGSLKFSGSGPDCFPMAQVIGVPLGSSSFCWHGNPSGCGYEATTYYVDLGDLLDLNITLNVTAGYETLAYLTGEGCGVCYTCYGSSPAGPPVYGYIIPNCSDMGGNVNPNVEGLGRLHYYTAVFQTGIEDQTFLKCNGVDPCDHTHEPHSAFMEWYIVVWRAVKVTSGVADTDDVRWWLGIWGSLRFPMKSDCVDSGGWGYRGILQCRPMGPLAVFRGDPPGPSWPTCNGFYGSPAPELDIPDLWSVNWTQIDLVDAENNQNGPSGGATNQYSNSLDVNDVDPAIYCKDQFHTEDCGCSESAITISGQKACEADFVINFPRNQIGAQCNELNSGFPTLSEVFPTLLSFTVDEFATSGVWELHSTSDLEHGGPAIAYWTLEPVLLGTDNYWRLTVTVEPSWETLLIITLVQRDGGSGCRIDLWSPWTGIYEIESIEATSEDPCYALALANLKGYTFGT